MAIHSAIWFSFVLAVAFGCKSRDYGNGGTVCVCTKNDCDFFKPFQMTPPGQFQLFTSSLAGDRFTNTFGTFSNTSSLPANNTILIDRNKQYQKIHGFGGAFTDSSGINILSLSNETRESLMKSYFSDEGIHYSMGRVPIGGTDFSTRAYSLDDVTNDVTLKSFDLQPEDYKYKIPFIIEAMNMTNNDLKLFATAWTAPAWMKTNQRFAGIGFLDESMYGVWADYHVKFFDAYREQGIDFWGLTTGNEPANGFNPYIQINDMGWVPTLHARWIAQNLGPKLRMNPYYSDIKIMIVDDQRVYYPYVPRTIFQNPIAKSYIDGCAVHYYDDKFVPADVLSITHNEFPDKFILATEACEGSQEKDPVILGSWDRAENYLNSIIDDLNNWSTGWMDWNIALNTDGGPTYVGNYVDSPIIVNSTADEFLKQPMYYALGHFSKFLRPGARRIHSKYNGTDLKYVVFQNVDNGIVASIFNPTNSDIPVKISDINQQEIVDIDYIIPKRSINTILYF